MRKFIVPAGVALLLSGCGVGQSRDQADLGSPLYAGRPCPGSATSVAGGPPTPYSCVPGGRESGGGGGRSPGGR
jgi:hypothetical protein